MKDISSSPIKRRVNIHEVAAALGKSAHTIRRLARAGKIPGARKLGQWSFDPERINAALARPR